MSAIPLTERQEQILDGIRDRKLMRDISIELGVSKQYVSDVVKQLSGLGLVVQAGRGKYVTTDDSHSYRRVPVEDHAIRLTTQRSAETAILWAAVGGVKIQRVFAEDTPTVLGLIVPGPDGPSRADFGDWIVRDSRGRFESVTHEAFLAEHEQEPTDA